MSTDTSFGSFPSDRLLHENLIHTARLFPENVAFRFAGTALTYAELDRRSDRLAAYLIQRQTGRGNRVGILMGRCLETAVAVYGILKAGAAYVPIDPTAPPDRIQSIVSSCEIEAIVTEQSRQQDVELLNDHCNALKYIVGCEAANGADADKVEWLSWTQFDQATLPAYRPPALDQEDVAYIMFTSGSTGIPKGIVHCHRSGQAYARLTSELFQLVPTDRIANHAPLHFDICTLGYLSAPRVGATTVIIPEPHTRMPASMAKLAADEGITIWYSVPFALIQLLTRGALEQHDFSSLRMVQYGGDPFSPKQIRALMDVWPGVAFYNIYGPAETNQCLSFRVPEDITGDEEAIPIGHVWDETQVRILDEDGAPVDADDVGELVVHSSTMMHGYWQNDSLNRRSFFDDEVRWFRTGDLVNVDMDGVAHYHGRKDRRVKVRGNRIELDEIEAAAMKHDAVEESAAYLLDQGTETERVELALLTSTTASEEKCVEAVRVHISGLLPRFAIPDSIVHMQTFPRTTSGKIDRNKIKGQRLAELTT